MWIEKASAQRPRVGADVRGRLLAADVLLARRQRQHEAAVAVGVDGLAAEAAGHLADELLLGRHQADIGAAEVQGVADRLALADDDVGAERAGRLEQAERDDLGDDDDQQRADVVGEHGELFDVAERAVEVGGLDDDRGGLVVDRHRHACRRGCAA